LVGANIYDLIDRAEDPETVIKQLLMDMNSQLLQAKTEVAAAIADEKQLYERYQQNQSEAGDYHKRAELAVEKARMISPVRRSRAERRINRPPTASNRNMRTRINRSRS
jgi:phage shock protein A